MQRITIPFFNNGLGDTQTMSFAMPKGGKIVGISKILEDKQGTVNSSSFDLKVKGSTKLTGICSGVATDTLYKRYSQDLGGTEEPIFFEKNDIISLEANITGGGSVKTTVLVHIRPSVI